MPLFSKLFRTDPKLEACLVQDSAHITLGAAGDHVSKIHTALLTIENVNVAPDELRAKKYGPSTAAAVLAYKTRRSIINTAYQKAADNIVGKMTIASLDREMLRKESEPPIPPTDPNRRPLTT